MKIRKRKLKLSKGCWVILILYFVFFLGDLISTLIIGDLVYYLEANPIFILTKSFVPIIIINILFMVYLCWSYMKGGVNMRFWVMGLVTWLALLRTLIIKTNIQVYLNPPTLEVAKAITTTTKLTSLSYSVILGLLIPLLITQLTFWFYQLDHKIKIKKK